ncbi:unnamed protein product [Symbiodinium natans]|uniref:Uncharacterized protein n=1 Tax=Symbiodinium natans TaxID=878477 RepID=A0A812IN77_9DINO|nr:unnamed protein product [Symbiodinium natans]
MDRKGPATSVCRADGADPRLLGRQTVGGKQQMLQVQRLEELAAEGRKAAKKNEVREGASGVGIGWAKVLREAKVRASKSKGSEVVGNLHEGARVLVEEVSSKAARIHLPFAGWITLAKASGPVLEQDSCNRRGSGEKSATQWVMEHTLARLRPADGHIGERVSMPSEMPVHPPECPEPADQGAMDTTSKLFAQLPSVGTWLAATPPVSALAAIDEGFPNPRVAPTNPLFVQLPSVGTWLAPAQAAFAQPHSVAHTEPPLAQSVRPACAFSHLPSMATWSMPSEMPVHPPECPEPADQGAMDTTSKLFAQLPSVGTWLAATPPVSALAAIDEGFPNPRVAPTNPLFVQLPSVGTWLAPAQAAFAQPHSVAHTEPPLAQSVRPACAFSHLPSVATWSMPSEMPVHPPECPEPADQGAMDTTSKLFAQLPSVGTWLAATPPVSALAAIDEGFPNPRVAPTNPLFVQLPSVGTWLAPAQAAFAQPHSVAHTEPPLAQYVRPASAFTHLPSVATWLAAKPAQVAAEVSDPAEPTRQPSPGSTPTGVWWLAFCNSLQQTLCCGRGK